MTFAPMAGMGGMMIPQIPTGMFGAGAKKANIADAISAAIGGYLAGSGKPGGAAILGMVNQRQQARADDAKYQRNRQDRLVDYAEMQKIQAQYGTPTQPHRWESNDGSLMELGPDGPRVVYKDPTPRLQAVPNGLGGVMFVNPQQFMQGQLPQTLSDDDWGGPTPQASGGFPY